MTTTTSTSWHEDNVTYTTDDPASQYTAETRACTSKNELIAVLLRWRRLAPDAYDQALAAYWPDIVWAFERAQDEQPDIAERVLELAGDIILPQAFVAVSVVADHYKAPWGLALVRMIEVGGIELRDGGWRLPVAAATDEDDDVDDANAVGA